MSATPELPPAFDAARQPAGSTLWRTTARVLPVGGAVEPGETLAEAAVRELVEEVGIVVRSADLGEPLASSTIEFDWGGRHIVQEQTFFAVRVEGSEVSLVGQDAWERATIDGHRWWTPDELAADGGAADAQIVEFMRLSVAQQT